ncbi:3'-5' exonuclease [Sulfurovum sp. bin170]|uniref:3'-5' exonuclease n=1 Tax=Sulfurovum sp. bin170 TaxID=2695268 RepID=UPI0013DF861C|nr:3'-5' exonuclease [Sulfurovum sp. bin170]NEW60013.1 3'-5' exonuclease [Sulfurovum sp. bin170]
MQSVYRELTSAFRRNEGRLSSASYDRIVSKHTTLFEDSDTLFLLLQASGYPIEENEHGYFLQTYITPYSEQKFCVIDIETNGSKPEKSQVIEVGAVMLQNGEAIDRFESFVECTFLPKYISKITGIEHTDLVDAPSRLEVLTKLREFIGDSIFVAHNANFDYGFLNYSFDHFGLGTIGNQVLCSIDLAKRTIESERYGLAYLNESLELGVEVHHRAYSDALTTAKLLNITFDNIPEYVNSADELLRFSISSRKERTLQLKNIKK